MKSLIEHPKPGAFRARCRKARWVPLDEVLTLSRDEQPDVIPSRWDHKLMCNVAEVRCKFDTDDRAAYVDHLKSTHPELKGPWESNSLDPRTYGNKAQSHRLPIPIPVKLWKGPRLKADGQPFDDTGMRSCSACGLVAEVDERAANVLWWTEHERMCTGTESAVA